MKFWKNQVIYDSDLKTVRNELIEIEGSEIEYNIDRMNELAKRREHLNDTFFRGGIRHHMNEIEKLLKAEEKENNDESQN